jgi:hypothetical protein
VTTVTLERAERSKSSPATSRHIVWDDRPDLALCGLDVTGKRWVGDEWPPCRACLSLERDLA